MESKIKSVLYARVSTDTDHQETSYLQQMKFQDSRFDIVKVFDDKTTGTSLKKRTGLIELLNYIGVMIEFTKDDYVFTINHTTDIKAIIVSSTSRLARNVVDAKRIINICHKQNVRIYFIDINSYSDNEQIEILLNIYFTLDQQYSKDLSKKIKHGMKRLAKNENHIFCTGTIKGFTLKAGKLSKNEESQKIINIFNDYAYNNIAIRGLAKKYQYGESTISSILKNKKYAGYNKGEDIEVNPNIEALIPLELWEEVQVIRGRRKDKSNIRGIKNNTYGLSSKLICPICGKKLAYRKGRNKKYGMWSCYSTNARNFIECANPSISENRINKYLKDMIKSNSWKEFIKIQINNQLQNIHLIDISDLKNRINSIDNKIDKLLDLYLSEELPKDKYLERKEVLELDKNSLLDQLQGAEDIQAYRISLESLERDYMDKLDDIESLIDSEAWEQVHQLIKNIYFNYTYDTKVGQDILNIDKGKKKLFISKVVFKDFDILDNFEL